MTGSKKDKATVGLGIIILRKDGKVLVGKRKGFVPKWSIPGGSLEAGEKFEEGAAREMAEETGLVPRDLRVVALTNNLETFGETGEHWVSVVSLVRDFDGEPRLLEPEKCEGWVWVDPKALPEPHLDASRLAVQCYLNGTFYEGIK